MLLILAAVLFLIKTEYAQAEEPFAGERKTVCVISQSDLDNFVSGARSTLEMIFAQNQQDWFTCTTEAGNRDLYLELYFSFDSYEDYLQKTEYLLGYEAVTTYGKEETPYVENFLPSELFGFADSALQDAQVTGEESFVSLLDVYSDITTLNGTEYEGTEALNTAGDNGILFDIISMETTLEGGQYTREVYLHTAEESAAGSIDMIRSRCENAGAQMDSAGEQDCRIFIGADSETELIQKTMILLQTAVNITHNKHYGTQTKVRMETVESLDLEMLLSKEGNFSYSLELPEGYENLSAQESAANGAKSGEDVQDGGSDEENLAEVNETTVFYDGRKGEIRYYYDEPVKFDRIAITTDLSNEWQKTERKITFYMDGAIAEDYYEGVKEQLSGRLGRGDTLRIYDDQGYRCYEVSFSSWFADDIGTFTDRIFGISGSRLEFTRTAFPFLKSSVRDEMNLGNSDLEVYSGSVTAGYNVPGNTEKADGLQDTDEGKMIIMEMPLKVSLDVSFDAFYIRKLVMYVFLGLIGISAVCGVVFGIRQKVSRFHYKRKRAKTEAGKVKMQQYCKYCGAPRNGNSNFCGKCGRKF